MFFGTIRLIIIDLIGGLKLRRVLKTINAHQYLPADQLNAIREKKLNRLFKIARQSTGFYEIYKSYIDVPVITKGTIMANPDSFISSSYNKKIFKKATGGSTGVTLTYRGSVMTQSYLWASLIHSWEATGYKRGEKVAFIAGSALIKSNWKHKIFYKVLNVSPYDAFALDENSIEKFIGDLQQKKVRLVFAYAMVMNILADHMNAKGKRSFPHLKAIVCTSEVMTEAMRKNIGQAFGTKVNNQYGCNEAGIMTFECEHRGLHLINTRCVYETDKEGALISTDLENDAFIFMKYNTGDIVEFEEGNCSCGRKYPVIKNVLGRMNDVVVDMNNKKFHSNFFNILFRKDDSIKQFQIQFNKETFTIYLRVDNSKPVNTYERFVEETKKYLCFRDYKIVINEPFLKSGNAKHRYIINTSDN